MIHRASSICGMGDALNQRAFLITYCKQNGLKTSDIVLYTEKYKWMFEGMGFRLGMVRSDFRGLVAFRNFGFYDMPETYHNDELDKNIAQNAGLDYSFEICVPFPNFTPPKVELPEKYITFNTGFGDLSGRPQNSRIPPDYSILGKETQQYQARGRHSVPPGILGQNYPPPDFVRS